MKETHISCLAVYFGVLAVCPGLAGENLKKEGYR